MLIVSQLEIADEAVDVVERKGLGHPDTICDARGRRRHREDGLPCIVLKP